MRELYRSSDASCDASDTDSLLSHSRNSRIELFDFRAITVEQRVMFY